MSEVTARAAQARGELQQTSAAFDGLRREFLEEIANSAPEHQDKRERLYTAVRVLDQVRKILVSAVDSGRIEEAVSLRHEIAEHSTLLRP